MTVLEFDVTSLAHFETSVIPECIVRIVTVG